MKRIIIALFLVTNVCFAQEEKKLSEVELLQTKVSEVEKKLHESESELIGLKKDLNIINEKAVDAKQRAYQTENKLWSERFGWLSGAIAFITAVMGTFIAWFGFRKLLENRANDIFEKYLITRFKDIKESDISSLYNEIESSAWKAQIRNKRILVINQEETKLPGDFMTALKIFKPEIQNVKEPIESLGIDFSKYSLVILENYEDEGFWDLDIYKEDLVKLADKICSMDIAFIYYGDGRKRFPETKVNRHFVNYANSPSQLYNNVMNTLKFQDLLTHVG